MQSTQVLALHPLTGRWCDATTRPSAKQAQVLVCFDHSAEPLEYRPRAAQHSWGKCTGTCCLVGASVELLRSPGSTARVLQCRRDPPLHLLKYQGGTVLWCHMPSEAFRVLELLHHYAAGSRCVSTSREPPDCVVPRPPAPIDIRSYRPDPRFHYINAAYPGVEAVHADPWIFLVHDVFTDAECDALVDKVKPHLKPSRMGGGLRPDLRTSRHMRCFYEETAGVQKRISALLNMPTRNFEGLKVINYQPGEFFKLHNDGFRGAHDEATGRSLWPCVPGNYPNRVVTLVVYLNDVARGGSTYFSELGIDVRPRKGMGLLFMPSYAHTSPVDPGKQYTRLKHEGHTCVDEKWICNQWGWGCEYIETLDPKSGFPPARLSASSI